MKRKYLLASLMIASLGIIVLSGIVPISANRTSVSSDFVMPDPAVYINTTYNGAIIDTSSNETVNIDKDATVTIWYILEDSEYFNISDSFLALKGDDGSDASVLTINFKTGPFFTNVTHDGTHCTFKIDYTVTHSGTTEFYTTYRVLTPCGQDLGSNELTKHFLVTSVETTPAPGFGLIATLSGFVVATFIIRRKQK